MVAGRGGRRQHARVHRSRVRGRHVHLPSRFTAPLAAIAAFFVLALSTEPIHGSQSSWQVSPIVTGPWDAGVQAGVATFYPFQPDLSIAQVMFLAGLAVAILALLGLPAGAGGRTLRAVAASTTAASSVAAAVIAVELAGTATLDPYGMVSIPALHDAANDQPIRFTPVCSHTSIPVCVNPAYESYLPSTAAALEPVLNQIAGLPGAPAEVLQEAATYQVSPRGRNEVNPAGPRNNGAAAVYRLVLPIQLPQPAQTIAQMAAQVRGDGWDLVANFAGDGRGASQAQDAVAAAIYLAGKLPGAGTTFITSGQPGTDPALSPAMTPGTPANAAAQRFAALPAQTRRAWLAAHLAALRAGQITLAQLP